MSVPTRGDEPWPPPLKLAPRFDGDDDEDDDLDVLASIIRDQPVQTTVHLADGMPTVAWTGLAPAVGSLIAVFLLAPEAPVVLVAALALAVSAASWFVAMRAGTKLAWVVAGACAGAVLLAQSWVGLPALIVALAVWFALSRTHDDRGER